MQGGVRQREARNGRLCGDNRIRRGISEIILRIREECQIGLFFEFHIGEFVL